MHAALVVLSGGFDSVALLHWALERHRAVRAVSFDYGQPHRDQELSAAQRIAERRLGKGKWERLRLTDLGPLDPEPGMLAPGIARAVVPGRNLVFLAYAANRAARHWAGTTSTVYYGANADDAAGFADCREGFVRRAAEAVAAAHDGVAEVRVEAPWVSLGYSKERIARWVWAKVERDAVGGLAALEDLRESVSCYRGTRCGACDACERRARAFEAAHLVDGTGVEATSGGDPARDAALDAGRSRR